MASTHTVELRIEKITTGEQSGTWGTTTNTQYDLWESAISGTTTVAFASDGNDTLTTANGSDDEARHMFLKLSGGATLSATREMVVPTSSKLYFVYNGTTGSQSVTIIGATGTGITVPNGAYMCLYHNGTNVINAFNNINITGGTVTGITDLVVADGGTGVSTLTDGGLLLGSGTGAITAMAVLADSEMVVGDGTTDPVAESGATLRTSIGVGTGDSPQFTGIELGHASDTTLTKASSGDMNIEGNIVYRAGGTDVPLTDGGTGSGTASGARTNLGLVIGTDVLAEGDTSIGIHSVPVPSTGMYTVTTNGASAGSSETSSNKVMIKTWDFDASTQEYVQFQIPMPSSWNESSTLTAIFNWSHPSTSTNFNVIWGIQAVAFGNSDALDAAFGTAVEVTDTGGTTDDLFSSSATSGLTPAGSPATNDHVIFRVYRKAADGSDTLAVDARLHSLLLNMTMATAVDV